MSYKAVLFDLDGTLMNTLEDLSDSMNAVLEQSGYPTHNLEEYKYFIGTGIYHLVESALPGEFRKDDTVKKFINAMRAEYTMRWDQKTRPYDGIPELLIELTNRNIKMAVLTNKVDDFAKLMTAKLLPHWRFEAVFGERPLIPKKPDPHAALEIAELLQMHPKDIILLGDSEIDMKTAAAAGMYGIGALWGYREADELMAAGARALIKSPAELLGYLLDL